MKTRRLLRLYRDALRGLRAKKRNLMRETEPVVPDPTPEPEPDHKALIFGSFLCPNPYSAWLIDRWIRLTERFPCDWLLVDSPSPPEYLAMSEGLKDVPYEMQDTDEIFDYVVKRRKTCLSFKTNFGHTCFGPHDTFARAFCQGVKCAIDSGYEYVAYIQGDMLCNLPVMDVVKDMKQRSLKVVSTRLMCGHCMEAGLMFMDVAFLREIDIVTKFAWRDQGSKNFPGRLDEDVLENIIGTDNIDFRPWRGARMDGVPYGHTKEWHFITHCSPEKADEFFEYAMTHGPARG